MHYLKNMTPAQSKIMIYLAGYRTSPEAFPEQMFFEASRKATLEELEELESSMGDWIKDTQRSWDKAKNEMKTSPTFDKARFAHAKHEGDSNMFNHYQNRQKIRNEISRKKRKKKKRGL